jgi:hypothetical protein
MINSLYSISSLARSLMLLFVPIAVWFCSCSYLMTKTPYGSRTNFCHVVEVLLSGMVPIFNIKFTQYISLSSYLFLHVLLHSLLIFRRCCKLVGHQHPCFQSLEFGNYSFARTLNVC